MDNTHESVDSATTEDQGPLNRQDLTDRSPGDSSGTTPEHLVLPGEPELEAAAVALHDLTGAQPELLGPAPAARKPHPAAAVQPDAEIGPTGRPWPKLPPPEPPSSHGPAMIVAMCNQKGGVGKTTSTINLGAALVETGRTVLLVDFDPQGSLSVGLGVNPHTLEVSIYNLLLGRNVSPDEVIAKTEVEGLDILPSNIDLSAAEVQLVSEVAREQTLLRVLEKVRDRYDVILIDCAPSLGLLTINALTAADKVIMPLECEFFALRGIALLTDTISKVQDRLNPSLEILGILGTMYDPRTLHSREVLERVVQAFGETVFHTVIRRTVKFPETSVAGEPITTYASASPGAEAYRSLAREVLARCHAA
ncbi:MAG: ParA-like protein [uncultured Propionibacteriaceae bacterium]|uniref:ParA-like protein n=1 Tax=uncultured Propionibacteriaceae bacterium TaxID=257457 RepID=A0A6J4P7R5_9ACTN|nr:MAG: ParA-like protein [uncultured Propionibacteriaceae bacterium]